MVVDQVHVNRHAVLEAKDDSPVPRDPHAPLSPPVSAQTVQPVAGEVQVARLYRGVEVGQDATNPRRQRCRDAPAIPPLEEGQQPLVRNLNIPTVTRCMTRDGVCLALSGGYGGSSESGSLSTTAQPAARSARRRVIPLGIPT